ncbi:MAG: hypothetical protein H8E57_02265 [Candidatus Cloacimonetes bacterium]|nr:hypothetical protein [Candidatus Cloacimonadota bacterium]
MKISFTLKIRLILILLFLISLIQGILILYLIRDFSSIAQLKMDIQNTIYITIFLQFILAMILVFYIPVFLQKAFSGINRTLEEITKGVYTCEIVDQNYETSLDKEFYSVMLTIKRMLNSILIFDNLKKEKIIEHHNRILALLKLTENGFLILDKIGNIVFINDKVSDVFPSLLVNINMIDTKFPPEVESGIKKYIVNLIQKQSRQEFQQYYSPKLKRHIGLSCAIVRDSIGEMSGAVVAISNLDKKKTEKKEEEY